ncbi:MAG: SpoIIE family protein phosphatase [Candidatus Riflebacteria bacterium]|nr:SpoIIE family protein phosphatase [Candidatus Riflebacteria bacterium]
MIVNLNLWASRVRWLMVCLVFFAFPFYLISWGLGNIWKNQEERSLTKAFEKLDSFLLFFKSREDTSLYIEKLLKKISVMNPSSPFWKTIEKRIHSLKRRFPGMFIFYNVDENGNIIKNLTDQLLPGTTGILRSFFLACKGLKPESPEIQNALKEIFPKIKQLIGEMASPDDICSGRPKVRESSLENEKRFFFYSINYQGGIFTHLNQIPEWDYQALKDQSARFNYFHKNSGIKIGVTSITENRNKIPSDLFNVLRQHSRNNRPHFQIGDALYSIMSLSASHKFWVKQRNLKTIDFTNKRLIFIFLGTLVFSIFAFFSHRVIVQKEALRISIRNQLLLLFGFTGGIPLAVVILAGWDYLNEKFEAKTRAAHEEILNTLSSYDAKFPITRVKTESKINFYTRKLSLKYGLLNKRNLKILAKMHSEFLPTDMVIFGADGKREWAYDQRTTAKTARSNKIIGQLTKSVLARLNKKYEDKISTAEIFLETMSGAENPIFLFIRKLDQIFDLAFAGTQRTWTYLHPIKGLTSQFTHLFGVFWRKAEMEEYYLRSTLLSAQREIHGARFMAIHREGDPQKIFPFNLPLYNKILGFIREVSLKQNSIFSSIQIGSTKFLLTGLYPLELSTYFLISICPDTQIRLEINGYKQRLVAFCFICVFMSFFLGFLLSKKMLIPISELSLGVQAIQDRKFRHRVPKLDDDELGDLADTFNIVMEGLSDMEIGRIVQESLFPEKGLSISDYEIYGKTRFASQLGGDYFDVQSMSDGKIMIIIGDVSGHGVAAALVMAMAKAIVEVECDNTRKVDEILSAIHKILFKTLKRTRMMTCFIVILDPETHVMEFANAGHNYPMVFHKKGEPTYLLSTAFPLGSKKKIEFNSQTMKLEPGEKIVFYTDGLIEAKHDKEMIGYEKTIEEIRKYINCSPQAFYEKIIEWHNAYVDPGPQEDDITLLILERKVLGEKKS